MDVTGEIVPKGLRRILVGSAVVHGLVVVGLFVSGVAQSKPTIPPKNFIATKLVRLGKPREEKLLPRKPKPPPQTKKAAVAPQAKPRTPAKRTHTGPSEEQRNKARLSDLLNRLKSDDEPEGRQDGSRDGEVSDLTRAIIGNKFATEVERCLRSNYAIEGIDPARVIGRTATVLVKVGPDGKFIDWAIEQASGLKAFDRAVRRAVRQCGKVSPPPDPIREQVKEDGIELVFKPD